jgi:DNA-binding transcriptional ArsR family regulator
MKVAARKAIKARKDYHTLIRIVSQNPGVPYRELLRASVLGYGTLERQLALLERLGLIKAHRVGGFTRYYTSDVYQRKTWNYSATPKPRAYREIIRLLLDDASGSFRFQKIIVQMVGKAPSTVSVQLGRLIDHKVVNFDEKRGYVVNNKPAIKRLLSKHKV